MINWVVNLSPEKPDLGIVIFDDRSSHNKIFEYVFLRGIFSDKMKMFLAVVISFCLF